MWIQIAKRTKPHIWLLLLLLFLSACKNNGALPTEDPPTVELPTATATIAMPSATPIPAAAIVNGERLPQAWLDAEFSRYLAAQEAMGQAVEDQDAARTYVLDDLIDQVLLAQAAQNAGFEISDEEVQARIDELREGVDLDAWMVTWGYSEDDLFQLLKLQLFGAHQKETIIGAVPEMMEQVELRQVFAYTEEGAKRALVSLNSGRDFDEVAFEYDSQIGGYLGWVPKGYLLISAVEEAAFSLPVGSFSDIIESEIGFHIVKVVNREERNLSSDALITLQRQALSTWLAENRENSTIEVLGD